VEQDDGLGAGIRGAAQKDEVAVRSKTTHDRRAVGPGIQENDRIPSAVWRLSNSARPAALLVRRRRPSRSDGVSTTSLEPLIPVFRD